MARIDLSGRQIPTLSKLNIDGEFTLDAQSGTSGQVLISQGSGNTPAWTSSLSSLTGLSSAATVALPISTTGGSGAVGLLSLTGGNTSSTSQNGGSINITGGNATNTTVINTGGTITIKAGNGNSTQGAGGSVYIDGGTGSVANGNGSVSIGTGSGTDSVFIGRSAITTTVNGTLTADQVFSSNNGSGTNFKVGDDVWLGDINVANTMSLKGQQSATSGYIRFGGDTNSLGYDGTKLSYGGNLTVQGRLSATGVPYAMAANATTTAAGTALAANAQETAVTVTFPASRFSVTPAVTANTSSPRYVVAITTASSTGFTMIVRNVSDATGTTYTYNWMAVQMTSGAVSG